MHLSRLPRLLLILFSGTLAAGPALAQEAGLGLPDLLHLALERNPDLASQRSEERIASLEQDRAQAPLLPQADAELGYLRTSGPAAAPALVGANGRTERIAWLTLQQSVFDGEALVERSAAHLDRQRQAVLGEQVRQDVLLEVVERYFAALEADEEVQAQRANVDFFQRLYEQSQVLFANGVVPELDVRKTRVEALLQQNELAAAQRSRQVAQDALKLAIGLALADSLTLQAFPPQQIHLDALEDYLVLAADRPALRAARLETAAARNEERRARWARLPTVDAGATYGWDATDRLAGDNLGWQVYASLRLPLWHGQQLALDRRIAREQHVQLEARAGALRQQLEAEVRQAFADCQLQERQVMAMTHSQDEAAVAVQMAGLGYREGTVASLDLIEAQKQLMRARILHLQSQYAFYTAKARLLRSTGQLREDLSWLE